ncbi:MAG: DUF359 domain-containing protein [Candidatus Thorarchaeota archaeon]
MTGTWALNLFDRFHIGHHVLIDRLCDIPEPVAAVSDGELIAKDLILSELIQPLDLRVKNLRSYLKSIELESTIRIETISSFDDLLAIPGATTFMMFEGPCCKEIEEKTLKLRKEKMGIVDVQELLKPVKAGDGDKMSSARVRLGEIDRKGRKLTGKYQHPRRLPTESREGLATPKGDVFATEHGNPEQRIVKKLIAEKPHCVITVGDVTTATILAEGYEPDVMVVDGITKRGIFEGEFSADVEYVIYNPPAMIYPEAWTVMETAIRSGKKSLITVEGEEDLMGFPAVLLADEGSVVLYGQPDVGIVWIPVNQSTKKIVDNLLKEMPAFG